MGGTEVASFTSWPHPDLVRWTDNTALLREPSELAAEVIARRSRSHHGHPEHVIGLLRQFVQQAATLTVDDVLDGMRMIVLLRRVLIYLEIKLLQRGRHWRGWVRQADIGRALGIGVAGVSMRRARLGEKLANDRPVQLRPKTPRISRQDAESIAEEMLDRRVELQDQVDHLPSKDDSVGAIAYILAHEGEVAAEVFAEDIVAAVRLVVATRRELEELELRLLDLGREKGIPNLKLGAPAGRRDAHATWKARQRIRNALAHGRHEVSMFPAETPTSGELEVRALDQGASSEVRALVAGLFDPGIYEALAVDEDLDEWLRWLREADLADEATTLTPAGIGLLWTVLLEEVPTVLDKKYDGPVELDADAREQLSVLIAKGERLRKAGRESPA